MFKKKMLLKLPTDNMVKFLSNFDKERTIGSITKKEVKAILKEEMDKIEMMM